MSETRSIGAAAPQSNPQVESAILRASQATGMDFGYLLGQARLESSLDPNARAGTSSAAGLFQFTKGTWMATLSAHGAEYGYGWANNPAMRGQALALRFDPQASALMAAELASDNRDHLRGVLGREPDPAELYLAHFLGAGGAGQFLTALAANPGQSAAALLPKAAAANRAIFFDAKGSPRSLNQVMDLIRGKMDRAMGGAEAMPAPYYAAGEDLGWGLPSNPDLAFSQSLYPDAPAAGAGPIPPQRASMAETLASAFGGSPDAMPGHVRSAYGKLQAFGL